MRAMNLISEPFYFSIKSSLEYVEQSSMLNAQCSMSMAKMQTFAGFLLNTMKKKKTRIFGYGMGQEICGGKQKKSIFFAVWLIDGARQKADLKKDKKN